MLKKINRLVNLKTNTKKQIFDTSLFKIKIFKTDGDQVRFGFVVSKKIDKRAVYRNKTKRVLSEAASLFLPEIKNKLNIVVIAKKGLTQDNLKEVIGEQRKVFIRAKII